MSIINFSPYRQYIYSPTSYIHRINITTKIFFTLLYLFSAPFIPSLILLLNFLYLLIYLLLIQYLHLKYKYKQLFFIKLFIYISLFILFIISSNDIIYDNHRFFIINYPYMKEKILEKTLYIIYFQSYFIPYILINTMIFIYNTTYVLNLLFYTTKLENIILLFLYLTKSIMNFQNFFYITFIFSFSLSSQFLYILINQVKNHNIIIKTRKFNKLGIKYLIYFYHFVFFINQLIKHSINITYSLYNKEIIKKNFYIIRI